MRILMTSSEGWPLARSGALADVVVALPRALKARGVIRIRLALLAVNARPIEELVAADEKNLEVLGGARFEEIGGMDFVA